MKNSKERYKHLIGNKHAKGSGSNKTSFKKGSIPWNKGTKGVMKSNSGSFKKGRKSNSKLPLNTITVRKSKRNKVRNFIKIGEPNKWEEYFKYLWKEKYGFIIKGDIIHHINGISNDDKIENLIALPRRDHPIFHNMWGLKKFTDKQMNYYLSRYTGEVV